MKAYLIDPWAKTVSEVEVDRSIDAIYAQIGVDCFCCVTISAGGDVLYVDDEGLFVEKQAFFSIITYPQPLAGKALCLGTDENGDSISPKIDLDTLAQCVTFHGELAPDDATRPQPFIEVVTWE